MNELGTPSTPIVQPTLAADLPPTLTTVTRSHDSVGNDPSPPNWDALLRLLLYKLTSRKFLVALAMIIFNIGSYSTGHTWQDLIASPANFFGLVYIIIQGLEDMTPASTEKVRAIIGV